jgi:hypothetical protein
MELETLTLVRAKSAEKENTPKQQYTNEMSVQRWKLSVKYEHLWDFSDQTEQIGFQLRSFLPAACKVQVVFLSPSYYSKKIQYICLLCIII